jgi:hypothetical protein
MANVVENGEGYLRVVLDGAADFLWATSLVTLGIGVGQKVSALYPQGLALTAVTVVSATASTVIIIRNKVAAGPIIPPKYRVITTDTLCKYFTGARFYKPCLVNADHTTPTNAEIGFEFDH